MMQRSLILLFTLLFIGALPAQEIRLAAGFNTIKVGNTGEDVSLSGGAGYQIEADAQFGQRIYLQPGLGYVVRNAVFTTVSTDPVAAQLVESKYTSSSFRIGLLGGYRFIDEFDRQSFNIRGFFGPSVLIGMNSSFDDEFLDATISDNATQWFLTVGAGIERDFLFADVGYDLALSNAFDHAGAEGQFNLLRVNLGVRLRFLGGTADTPIIDP